MITKKFSKRKALGGTVQRKNLKENQLCANEENRTGNPKSQVYDGV